MYYCDMVWHIYSTKRGTAMHAKIKCAALMLLLFSPALLPPVLLISELRHLDLVADQELQVRDGVAEEEQIVVQCLIHECLRII